MPTPVSYAAACRDIDAAASLLPRPVRDNAVRHLAGDYDDAAYWGISLEDLNRTRLANEAIALAGVDFLGAA